MYTATSQGAVKVRRVAMEIWAAMSAAMRFVCCGLDPGKIESFPREALVYDTEGNIDVRGSLFNFCCRLVDATAPFVGSFKPNAAFWERYGDIGMLALRDLVRYIHENYPDHLVIVDAKANDLGKTADEWAYKYFVWYDFDAVTVNPYMGWDCVGAFTKYQDKMVIVLVRTSNKSAKSMQDIKAIVTEDDLNAAIECANLDRAQVPNIEQVLDKTLPYYQWVGWQVANIWNGNVNCAAVIGATVPDQMSSLVVIMPSVPKLSPGFGNQGAKVDDIIPAAVEIDNALDVIANSSTNIMYAFKLPEYKGLSFEEAAAASAKALNDEIVAAYERAVA